MYNKYYTIIDIRQKHKWVIECQDQQNAEVSVKARI